MITKDYVRFFKDLEKNNNRDWFQENKKRYESRVREPFIELIAQVLDKLREDEPELPEDPKKTLFRINRDIRFSNDKTPYNLWMSAALTPGGKKSELPGYYVRIDASHIHVGGGLYAIEKEVLKNIRGELDVHPESLTKILEARDFQEMFGDLKGDRHKRLDPEFRKLAETFPYIANKQFYAMTQYDINKQLGADLPAFILKHHLTIRPLNQFLTMAME